MIQRIICLYVQCGNYIVHSRELATRCTQCGKGITGHIFVIQSPYPHTVKYTQESYLNRVKLHYGIWVPCSQQLTRMPPWSFYLAKLLTLVFMSRNTIYVKPFMLQMWLDTALKFACKHTKIKLVWCQICRIYEVNVRFSQMHYCCWMSISLPSHCIEIWILWYISREKFQKVLKINLIKIKPFKMAVKM